MTSLGSFGAAMREFDAKAEQLDFEFFGETFVIRGAVPSMLVIQLGSGERSTEAMWRAFEYALSEPGDDGELDTEHFARFVELATTKRADMDSLISLVWAIVGAQTGKATERQRTSPETSPPDTTNSSTSSSPSPDSPALRPVDEVLAG